MTKSADRYCLQKIFMAGKIHLSQYIFKLLSTESTLGITSFTASKYVLTYLVIKYGKKTVYNITFNYQIVEFP